ncbi:uncharacterized protein [Chelonus insularis]|uniref:uncharacterized protein n=1 Tax=Chelonus insularis TaxID=460826 RepID=UPI00158F07E8|nr:uncharacterized protein LOC118064813 [Chelonus insularis]
MLKSEGLRLLSALCNLRHTLKNLYCWNIFGKMENLISEHYRNVVNSKVFFNKYRIEQFNECLKALGSLDKLTTISLNYIYLAIPNEESLIELANNITCHFFTSVRITGYEQQQHFLTENIPLHTLVLSSEVDLETQTPLMVDCFIKLLWSWYPETLVDLNLRLWHQREDLDHLLKNIFINLPKLETFKFMGEIKTLQTISTMCCQIQMKQSSNVLIRILIMV